MYLFEQVSGIWIQLHLVRVPQLQFRSIKNIRPKSAMRRVEAPSTSIRRRNENSNANHF